MRRLTAKAESWPLHEPFVISRLTQETGEVVVVEIEEDGVIGRGESERAEAFEADRQPVLEVIEAGRKAVEEGASRIDLLSVMPSGHGRNAVDCALWDLEAKKEGKPAWRLAGQNMPKPVTSVFTISLGEPEQMAKAAARNADRPVLKLKLGGVGDVERVAAVRKAAPNVRLVADANEGWTPDLLDTYLPALADLGVELLEQPLPHGHDEALAQAMRVIPICADESCLDRTSLPSVLGRYDFVNIKLDKTGGLTEALLLAEAARKQGLGIMVGCNLGTSLAMAPAVLVAQLASFVDLDGPLLLSKDRDPCLEFRNSEIQPPPPALWG